MEESLISSRSRRENQRPRPGAEAHGRWNCPRPAVCRSVKISDPAGASSSPILSSSSLLEEVSSKTCTGAPQGEAALRSASFSGSADMLKFKRQVGIHR